jgi:hypothetical protein
MFRRDPRDERFFEYRSRHRGLDEPEVHRSRFRRAPRGFGWARRRDLDDVYSQQAAPRGGGRYDRSGEEGYARGLEQFEASRHGGRAYGRGGLSAWELDQGGVQFGQRPFAYRAEETGPHRGRGPRGYQRSDERIREDVCDCLTEADDVDASNIDVQVTAGTVTLSGTVDGRYAKRRAEDIAESVSGVREVQNQLRQQAADGDPPGGL